MNAWIWQRLNTSQKRMLVAVWMRGNTGLSKDQWPSKRTGMSLARRGLLMLDNSSRRWRLTNQGRELCEAMRPSCEWGVILTVSEGSK